MALTIAILPIGHPEEKILRHIEGGLVKILPETVCFTADAQIEVPKAAFNKDRGQYNSNYILGLIQSYSTNTERADRVLGVADVDIFAPGLNFVFGEASFPGKAALVSLKRLRPNPFRSQVDAELYIQRSLKEAIHEIGHTLGLRHCSRASCVMHFSNSIFDTDKKQSLFCDECYMKAALVISSLEKAQ